MTRAADVLVEGFERVAQEVERLCDGATPGTLATRPGPEANTPAWIVWHLTRVQDDHVAEAFGSEQVWADGWVERFALPFGPEETGWGFDTAQVGEVRAEPAMLAGYHAAVHARTLEHLSGLTDDDLDRVVDDSYDPPVTLLARLVSVLQDDLEHVGQAAYALGSF